MLKKIVLQDTQGVLQDSECSGFSCVAIQWDWIGGCVTIQNLYCDSGLDMLARRQALGTQLGAQARALGVLALGVGAGVGRLGVQGARAAGGRAWGARAWRVGLAGRAGERHGMGARARQGERAHGRGR